MFLITACFMLMLLSGVDNDTAIALNHPSVDCDLVSFLIALCSWFIAFKGTRGKQEARTHCFLKSQIALGTEQSTLVTDIYSKPQCTCLNILPAQSRCK